MENGNTLRDKIIEDLNVYYSNEGIVPDDFFACKHKKKCKGELARGMQCGIGNRYGEKTKIVVVSLDCGGGGKADIADRTQGIIEHLHNPHMKGTLYCTSMLLNFIDFNSEDPWGRWSDEWKQNIGEFIDQAIPFFAMTNSCKCCRIGSTTQLAIEYYEQCSEYKLKEIEILEPDIVIFQGKNAIVGCEFTDIEELKGLKISEYLKNITLNGKTMFAIKSIHPSARGRHYKKVKFFMNQIFPEIVKYINSKKDSFPLD